MRKKIAIVTHQTHATAGRRSLHFRHETPLRRCAAATHRRLEIVSWKKAPRTFNNYWRCHRPATDAHPSHGRLWRAHRSRAGGADRPVARRGGPAAGHCLGHGTGHRRYPRRHGIRHRYVATDQVSGRRQRTVGHGGPVRRQLFGGRKPVGDSLRIKGFACEVVGPLRPRARGRWVWTRTMWWSCR